MVPGCACDELSQAAQQKNTPAGCARDRHVGFIWFVLFIWLVWFNQTNQTDQINKRNQPILARPASKNLCAQWRTVWPGRAGARSSNDPSASPSKCRRVPLFNGGEKCVHVQMSNDSRHASPPPMRPSVSFEDQRRLWEGNGWTRKQAGES